jgi:vacuolar-type H+-ATPase subunit H
MGKEPEVIERDIEATREDLTRNVDELADRVSPGRVVGRKVDSVKGGVGSVKDKVMGSAHSAAGSTPDGTGRASDAVSGVASRAEGSPLAAGLVAFGAGLVIASLIPASDKEAQLAEQAVDAAKEHGQPVVDQARSVGQEIGGNLKESATEAASELKSSAQDSAQHVASEGQHAAQEVKQDTQG